MANLNILVMNNKGGSGKTTVATNLAAAYACRNVRVALMDCDAQANARHWGQSRSDDDLPIDIQFHPDPRTIDAVATASHDVCIYDSAPAITHGPSLHLEFETLLKLSDVILVPMLGSSWDIQSGEHFITQLMTQRVWRAKPRPIAVISNRVGGSSANHQRLQNFLSLLSVPAVTTLRESPVYPEAGDSGQGVVEMKHNRAARKEFKAWHTLTDWIDSQTESASTARRPGRPLAAGRQTPTTQMPELGNIR
jgi:chromosome partitioning protein